MVLITWSKKYFQLLKIDRDCNWIDQDPNDEFDNLITFVKTLFSRYRDGSILGRRN